MVLIIKSPSSIELIEGKSISYCSPNTREILEKLGKKEKLESDFFNYLCLRADAEEIEEKDVISEIKNCLREIQSLEVRNCLDQISKEIKKAKTEKDEEKEEELFKQFKEKTSELTNQ
jgi:replicative DNA helicase